MGCSESTVREDVDPTEIPINAAWMMSGMALTQRLHAAFLCVARPASPVHRRLAHQEMHGVVPFFWSPHLKDLCLTDYLPYAYI